MVKEETAPEGTVSSGLLFKMIGLFHQFLGDFTADGALEVDAGGGSAEKEIAEQAARVEMSNAFFIGCSFCEVFAAKLNIFL